MGDRREPGTPQSRQRSRRVEQSVPSPPAPRAEDRPARLGLQLYSLRDEVAADLPGVLARVDAIGYAGVEFAGFGGHSPHDVMRALTATNLAVAAAHIGLAEPDTFKAALDDHAVIGCDTAVIPAAFDPGFGDLDKVRRTADIVNGANAIARAHGFALGYHNHFWELDPLADGRPALLHFYDHVEHDVIAEVDVYWAQVGGADPAGLVTELGSRAVLLHVKDGPADDRTSANVAVGDGAVDIAAVLGAAADARWHLVEFDRCETDIFEAIERSYAYLAGPARASGRP